MFDSTHIELINLFARRAGRWLEEAALARKFKIEFPAPAK
jgi:hypothetical protein